MLVERCVDCREEWNVSVCVFVSLVCGCEILNGSCIKFLLLLSVKEFIELRLRIDTQFF